MTKTLERFEELVLKGLGRYCDTDMAQRIMDLYLPVLRLLDNKHDGARIQAEMLYKAYQNKVDPDQWVAHIQRTRKKYSPVAEIINGGGQVRTPAAARGFIVKANPEEVWQRTAAYKPGRHSRDHGVRYPGRVASKAASGGVKGIYIGKASSLQIARSAGKMLSQGPVSKRGPVSGHTVKGNRQPQSKKK